MGLECTHCGGFSYPEEMGLVENRICRRDDVYYIELSMYRRNMTVVNVYEELTDLEVEFLIKRSKRLIETAKVLE